jgi:hypothetical protein
MLHIDETIDTFRRGVIDLDCKRMVLSQHKENGPRFEGQGNIRQNQDGALAFKLYVGKYENIDPIRYFDAELNAVPGKIYADDRFYDLEAVGHDGTCWTAARILVKFKWNLTDGSVLINGGMQWIRTTLDYSPQPHHYLRLHFFEEYKVPVHLMSRMEEHGAAYLVRDRATFEACGSKFEVQMRPGSGDTVIEVTSNAAFPAAFHLRIQEALQYITAKTAIWRARLESETNKFTLELASPQRKSGRTQLGPPITPGCTEFLEHGWKLFGCYLAYVVEKTKGAQWNPVAYHFHNACEATANSVDAWALGVSVAAEAVASLIKLPSGDIKAERIKLFQARMHECLRTDFSDLISRVKGYIDGMSNKRPQDTMHALASTGHIEGAYIKDWTSLRNRQAHPKLKNLKEPNPVDNQELLDRIHRVEVLLRQLTFYLIGYKGPYTDYGTENFLIKQYPLRE